LPGVFVAIEGLDGSGKTTIARRLADSVGNEGWEAILTREPGGTAIGEAVRGLLLGPASGGMLAETEALLFAAARAQHVGELIRPALSRGAFVICDRFVDSSLAYQWGGRGLPLEAVVAAQRLATAGLEPDVKVLLDLSAGKALRRRAGAADDLDRIDAETLEFHDRVRKAYHELVKRDPTRWLVIAADRDASLVWDDVWASLSERGIIAHRPQRRALGVATGEQP
jgi:dTMP kinase